MDGWMLGRTQVLEEFRRNVAAKGEGVEAGIALAKDYAFLLHSVNGHLDLLLDMNISTDRASRQRETVKKIARRVGLRTSYEDDLDD
mmetsp:Transcript_2431/g.6701  ORF Transcript_2431/g.6701 Transcript_2431/m.6701 type:complete len:87 (-) Transcript_2431:641-901(-)